MTRRMKFVALGIAFAAAAGFGWYWYTDGYVTAPFLRWSRYEMSGSSMEPTMADGESFYCEPLSRQEVTDLRPATIVVVDIDGRLIVKRLVAQSGDVVEGRGGQLLLNGDPLLTDVTDVNELGDFGPVEVPADQVFVLGDNFVASADSRSTGPVSVVDVECRVRN